LKIIELLPVLVPVRYSLPELVGAKFDCLTSAPGLRVATAGGAGGPMLPVPVARRSGSLAGCGFRLGLGVLPLAVRCIPSSHGPQAGGARVLLVGEIEAP
jgi:hypothetical protein